MLPCLAAEGAALTTVFAPVVVTDLLPISPKPVVYCGRGEEEGVREPGEQRDWKVVSAGLNDDNQMIKRPAARTKCGLVEAPGVEPGSEDRQHNGSTCVADRFHFAATHAHRLA